MPFPQNIAVCHRCPDRERGCAGACACRLNGLDIAANAERHECPAQRFPSRGAGDTLAKVLHATGVAAVVKAVAGEDCGCAGRAAKLNAVLRYRQTPP